MSLRAPVSESLSRLSRDQLQKFAQYLISELPEQILPTSQRLLDDLILNENSDINKVRGAPDPTAGASVNEQTKWCLDESQLHENIRKIVIKICMPSPMVYSDVNYLSAAAPPAAAEWTSLLRPLRGREPEGLWNLLSIVREMLRRHDRNSIPLLRILTTEILACDQILIWWFNTNVSLHRGYPPCSYSATGNGGNNNRSSMHSNMHSSQHACSSLCDEIVVLWRLVTLNPILSQSDKKYLFEQLREWHLKTLSIVAKFKTSSTHTHQITFHPGINTAAVKSSDIELFSGFKPAMISCLIDWINYPIQGITDQKSNRFNSYSSTINAQSATASCSHAISGTMVKLTSSMNWKSLSNKYFQDNNNDDNPNNSGKTNKSSKTRKDLLAWDMDLFPKQFPEAKENEGVQQVVAKDNSNDNSEDSGMNNQESFWDRASSSDDDEEENSDNAGHNDVNHSDNVNVGDDYQIYVYNTHSELLKNANSFADSDHKQYDATLINASQVKPIEDSFEVLFARAEALYAHGYVKEACNLSAQLAEQLLKKPVLKLEDQPDLTQPSTSAPPPPPPSTNGRNHSKRANRNRFNPALHRLSLLASATFSKASFLCQVLSENLRSSENCWLAFRVGLFGLELPRHPASTKALEVKLANQEQELMNLMKRIPLNTDMLGVLRQKAVQLTEGNYFARGQHMLPLTLASYIFDALALAKPASEARNSGGGTRNTEYVPGGVHAVLCHSAIRNPNLDCYYGFAAALEAIGMKINLSEAEHPLLCEGIRRQRGDLALALLLYNKDCEDRLNLILDKLLDKDIHQIHRKPPNTSGHLSEPTDGAASSNQATPLSSETESKNSNPTIDPIAATSSDSNKEPKSDSSKDEPDSRNWIENLRDLKLTAKVEDKSEPARSVDSSAPETTSSDNSPTVSRRNLYTAAKNSGSESSSSAESSDSFCSISSNEKIAADETSSGTEPTVKQAIPATESPLASTPSTSKQSQPSGKCASPYWLSCSSPPRNHLPSGTFPYNKANMRPNQFSVANSFKPARYKGKRGQHYPVIPNQPSEASAHFMFELAKTVLAKAGGNTSVLFTQPQTSQSYRAPQRNLHMCAFQIGLYALGLHNAVSPNWLSRTYSSHVSWITNQAMEIGHQAISFLIDTWEGHLTPPEVSSLADRASRVQEKQMVEAAANLALSVLPYSQALTINETLIALGQCKEQSTDMLELACLAVESAAQGGGVYPEVLFEVARKWYDLYEKEKLAESTDGGGGEGSSRFHQSSSAEQQVAQCADNGGDSMREHDRYSDSFTFAAAESSQFGESATPHAVPVDAPVSSNTVQLYQNSAVFAQPYPFNVAAANSNYNPYTNLPYYGNYPGLFQPTVPLTHTGRFSTLTPYGWPHNGPKLDQQQPLLRFGPPYTTNFYHPLLQQGGKPQQPTQMPPYFVAAPPQPPPPSSSSSIIRTPFIAIPNQFTSINAAAAAAAAANFAATGQFFPLPPDMPYLLNYPATTGPTSSNPASHQSTHKQTILGPKQLGYMHATYRVGMLAMDTMARRVHDDRPQVKYARNPHYSEDVKWLLCIAKKLGTFHFLSILFVKFPNFPSLGSSYIQDFCICALNAVASPFVLYEIIIDAAQSLAHPPQTNSPYIHNIRSQILTPLIQKCHQM